MVPILVLIAAFAATFVSSMSGGGSSIITIPLYLWMGIPFPLATLMQNFGSTLWVLPASRNYLKGRQVNWKSVLSYAAIGMIGAVIGSNMVARINPNIFKPVIGVLIIILVCVMATHKKLGITEHEVKTSSLKNKLMYLTAPFLGFYESIFGSGNGIIFSTLSIELQGNDLTRSLGYYYFISFFWNLTTVVVLLSSGYKNIPLMTAAAIGGILGGYFGSKLGRHKGNRFVKYAFMIVGTILGLKLIIGF